MTPRTSDDDLYSHVLTDVVPTLGQMAASRSAGHVTRAAVFLSRREILVGVAIFTLAVAVYANSATHAFTLDDRWLILYNPLIQSLRNVPTLLASNYYAPTFEVGLYRPLTTLSYALNHAWGALEPGSYHRVNIVLHGLNAALLFRLARGLGMGGAAAAFAGALFAAHAVHAEVVANVAGRAELLSTFFFLLALACHAARERGSRGDRPLYLATLASYLLALLSKENAIGWIGVVVLHDAVFVEARSSLRSSLAGAVRARFFRVYGAYLLVTAGYLALRWWVLRNGAALPPTHPVDNPMALLSFPWSQLNALQVAWRYVGLLLFPVNLTYDYSYAQIPLIHSAADIRLWWVLGLTVAGCWACLNLARRGRRAFFAVGFALATFAIVSNLVVPIGTIMAERLVYLPSAGFCLGLAFALERWNTGPAALARFPRAALLVLATTLVAAHSARAVARSLDWRSDEHLFVQDVKVSSRSAKALNNAGWILIDRGIDVARGVSLVERALEIWPNDAEYLDSLGWGYYKLGEYKRARELLRRSLALDPAGPTRPDREAHLRTIERALQAQTARQERKP